MICEAVREVSSRAVTAVAVKYICEAVREVSSKVVTAVAVVTFVKLSVKLAIERLQQ